MAGKAKSGIPAHDEVAINVAHALPWSNCCQVRWFFSRGEPLRNGEVRVAAHGDLAGAPASGGEPFDEIVTVSAVLLSGEDAVTIGVVDPTCIRVANGITVRAPERRIGTLELSQSRELALVDPKNVNMFQFRGSVPPLLPYGLQATMTGTCSIPTGRNMST